MDGLRLGERTRAYGIYPDIILGKVGGHIAGHLNNSTLTGMVIDRAEDVIPEINSFCSLFPITFSFSSRIFNIMQNILKDVNVTQ